MQQKSLESNQNDVLLDFIRNRITELRIKRGISEVRLSYEIGHSRTYINSVTSGRVTPSITALMKICEALEVSMQSFFDVAEKSDAKRNVEIWLSTFDRDQLSSLNLALEAIIKTNKVLME